VTALLSSPLNPPAFSNALSPAEKRPADSFVLVRSRVDTEAAPAAAPDVAADAPATRSDIARLEDQLAELLRRDEERAASLARIEDTALDVLHAVESLRERLDGWPTEAEA
jgi:hypothetical protein